MKKIINSLLTLCCLLCPSTLNAYDFMVDGIAYNKNSNGISVSVTYNNYHGEYSGVINIPSNVIHGSNYKVTAIGYTAFLGCHELTSVTIPNTIATIGDYAFLDCPALTELAIPYSVNSIGNYAFAFCDGLESIVVDNANTVYDSRNNCNAIIEKASNKLIAGCNQTIIPNSVTSIGANAFWGISDLNSFRIGENVTSIDSSAFHDCTGLRSITIPKSVISIGDEVFFGCKDLKAIYCYIKDPSSVSMGSEIFNGVSINNCVLHVPKGTKSLYYQVEQWKDFTHIVDDVVIPTTGTGDVNGDGIVNVSDVTTLINMILGLIDKNEQTADVNGNGNVNVSDVTALINIILNQNNNEKVN